MATCFSLIQNGFTVFYLLLCVTRRVSLERSDSHQYPQNPTEDSSCISGSLEESLKNKFNTNVFPQTFSNDSHSNISFLWTGDDDSVILVVTMSNGTQPSTLYVSEDCGKNYKNMTDSLNNIAITHVRQSPGNRKLVILEAYSKSSSYSTIFLVVNGLNIKKVSLPFHLRDAIRFHPTNQTLFLALGSEMWKSWLSSDGGYHWEEIVSNVDDVQWSQYPNDKYADTFYFTNGSDLALEKGSKKKYDLVKSTNLARNFMVVLPRVRTFRIAGKFLYALTYDDKDIKKSILKVSTNGGLSWNEAQLPIMVEDQFYEILEMSDGMVFIHVDMQKGCGSLFTSDADGIIFAESLRDHLYIKDHANDFYKVKSMRGVYLTTQLAENKTFITYNRGAKWTRLNIKPNCALKIVNNNEAAQVLMGPLSAKSAIGIILAHGYGCDSVKRSTPDVYISSDGGYNWKKALTGPHLFAIADHGGLLVAVPLENNQTSDQVKFSLDEGETWYCYNFTTEKIKVTGLLTDPESWSLKVGIWGRGVNDSVWRVTVIDFQPVIERQCKEPDDFANFTAHNEMTSTNGTLQGCLLGAKETFRKVKKGSSCFLGRTHSVNISTEHCKCTEDDYECDYGYARKGNSKECVENPLFKGAELDVCLDGEERKIETYGYRKIPGDVCDGGYDPGARYEKSIKIKCHEGDKILLGGLQIGSGNSPTGVIILIILIIAMTGLIFGMSVFFIRKFQQISTSPVTYRYSRLSQDACDDETMCIVANNLGINGGLSDEDDGTQPATLLVDTSDALDSIVIRSNGTANRSHVKKYIEESDEELLQ